MKDARHRVTAASCLGTGSHTVPAANPFHCRPLLRCEMLTESCAFAHSITFQLDNFTFALCNDSGSQPPPFFLLHGVAITTSPTAIAAAAAQPSPAFCSLIPPALFTGCRFKDQSGIMSDLHPTTEDPADQQQHIELVADEERDWPDVDSALGLSVSDSLTSLRSSVLAYQQENGRTYHAMSAGKYFLPNDDAEVERLDLQHHVMTFTLDDQLCLSPKKDGANRVLDLGTGTGIWCIEYADEHPEAEVIGVDLSPVQPNCVPPNCRFEIDDLEKDWTWSKPFDFILSRMMTGSFADNASIVAKVYNQLEPGGYFEAHDMALPLGCDDGTLSEDSDLWIWMTWLIRAMEALGRPLTAAQNWKPLMEEAGFEDVVETVYKWPTNSWPRDPKYKKLGQWSLYNMDQVLEPAILAPLTRALGWSREEAVLLAARARKVLRDPRVHAYWPIYVVYGRKPLKKREE
ncbi:S-adenosyl-L-methionine-dependent methyltransferase [Chaetomium strumarium]|uniref:S-adenosyl-L-methionine-dependent methyltransferase n=1 Tax=Chaetomium strumarium TaxID=1170767 RepID=A0AAJ0M6M5_9PEZI|nr:S-adenosyl-L-methionine-dependent methyltransferase [Chaetomium strumarium]